MTIRARFRRLLPESLFNMRYLLYGCVLFLVPFVTQAATLSILPASGSYAVGDTIAVSVAISSNTAVNAVSSSLLYSADTLELRSISKEGSIISLWVQEPSFSSGRATVEGAILNPGYTGASGRVARLVFRARSPGPAYVRFASAEVLANDGVGTNVYEGASPAAFTIAAAPAPSVPAPSPAATPAPAATSTPEVVPEPSPVPVPQKEEDTSLFSRSSERLLEYASLSVLLGALLVAALLGLMLAWRYMHSSLYALRKGKHHALYANDVVFEQFFEDLKKHERKLRSAKTERALTKEEEAFIDLLDEHFKKAKGLMRKEIEKIGIKEK